jgi:hypothetical protein
MDQIHEMDELLAYLDEMTKRAKSAAPFGVKANVESICAHMWQRFTPHALSFWTPAGVLQHIATCLSPPEPEADEED